MDLRPSINDPVILRDPSGREHRSRVEDLGPDRMVVARPHDLLLEEAGPGAELQVTWVTARGIAVLPTRIVEARSERALDLWSLEITGPGQVDQRRRFVRVPARGAVTLRPATDAEPPEDVAGQLVEVSEAALRCAVDPGVVDRLAAEHPAVTAAFRFGDGHFTVPGHVEAARVTARPAELAEVVVRFDEPVADADALRKEIFGQQLRSLRSRDAR